MAPVTRRKSATASARKDGSDEKTKKVRKNSPSPIKSALRHKSEGVSRARQVTFEHENNETPVRPHLPSTPYPEAQQQRRVPTPEPSPPAPTDHNLRKEREELLKRAARALDSAAKASNNLPTPPQSPRGGKPSAFSKPGIVLGGRHSDKPTETETDAEAKADAETETDKEDGADEDDDSEDEESEKKDLTTGNVELTSRHIDLIKDQIPTGTEMPESIENILNNPSAKIKMEEICTAFDFLKEQIQSYVRMHYGYRNRNQDQIFLTFTQLKVQHPELFRYIQYVADGSQYGWDKLLSLAQQRELLVYGIISRALIAHVFDAELFGASSKDEETLLQMCRTYLNYDAFVRNTHRAEIISPILLRQAKKHALSGDDTFAYFKPALKSLGDRITILLQPLHKQEKIGLMQRSVFRNHIDYMSSILKTALKIHLAIRLAGSNGTVYRFEHTAKHTRWDHTTMNCINQLRMDLTAHHGDTPLVKISCFPAIFATVPSGPTLESFADPTFVKQWQATADEDSSKPLITTYPITLSDVALENTPRDRSGFVTLSKTMAHEQARMSDAALLNLTGINRPRIRRLNSIGKMTRKYASRVVGAGLAAAAVTWYFYRNRAACVQMLKETSQRLRDPDLLASLLRRTVKAPGVSGTVKVTETVASVLGGATGAGARTGTGTGRVMRQVTRVEATGKTTAG